MHKRKICIVTGSRADYGLLYWLMKEIQDDRDLQLQIVVTGMHLSPEFGLTYKVIEEDGFTIDAKVEMLLSSDTPVGIAKSMGVGVIGFADALDRLRPDILALLGDRFEILAVAQAAMVARIPMAHIHGGEATEGLIDEAIRHAVTKMAHFHFVAAEPYRKRVIQMGEHPERVYNFGAVGLDNIHYLTLLDRHGLERSLDFILRTPVFLVTYHPVTLSSKGADVPMRELLKALDNFLHSTIIFTKTNSDTDGRVLGRMVDEYVEKNSGRAKAFVTLGQVRYLSVLKEAAVVIGNSSSGIIEAPALDKPTVNLGERQQGRLKPPSVIDCAEWEEDIVAAINKALSPEFIQSVEGMVSPYGVGGASAKIKEVLKKVSLEGVLIKVFRDMPVST